MKIRLVLLLTSLAVALLGSPAFPAQESVPAPPLPPAAPVLVPPAPGPVPPPPPVSAEMLDRHTLRVSPVERTAPGQYRIGDILVNAAEKSVTFPAEISMEKGLLEYLLVRTGGKTYESLLRTGIEPYNLQVACLLVGLVGTDRPLGFQGDPAVPRGDPVEIILRPGTSNGRIKPEQWLMQTINGENRETPPLHWVFTGSLVRNGRLASQVEGSLVAIFHDPIAMIDNATPGGESDTIWFVKEGAVPPVGTPVSVTIKPVKGP